MPFISARTHRLVAGLSLAAATAAGTLLSAAPADAATTVRAVVLAHSELRITGSESGDDIVVTGAGPVFVSNSTGPIEAGPGCVPVGSRVRCDGVTFMQVFAMGGNDTVRNSTPLPGTTLSGGGGDDRLTGSFTANDFVTGDVGTADVIDGRGGFDTCFGETESNCER